MKQKMQAARLSLWASRCIALTLLALLIFMPRLLAWYAALRELTEAGRQAILIAFYCCAAPTAAALWDLDRLLGSILAGQVFISKNVRRIRRIRWYCGGIALICLPAAFCYPPLSFMVVIMAFLCLVVSTLAQVMAAAVALREENDLTI